MRTKHEVVQALNEELELHRQITTAIYGLLDKRDELEESITRLLTKHKELIDCG